MFFEWIKWKIIAEHFRTYNNDSNWDFPIQHFFALSGRTGLSHGLYFMEEFSPSTKIPNPLRVGMW